MKKKSMISILLIFLLFSTAGGVILYQNSFAMLEQTVEIPSPAGKLTGTLVLPKNYSGKLGLVLFIHGDGEIDASHNDGYKPLWERLSALGYASLSLNKRGINGSEGSWLDQTMDDRVQEAREAIAWAKKLPMIDENRIGVWGASQAGWVIPKLAAQESLAFSLLVSPAINWLSQGKYHTYKKMEKAGFSTSDIQTQEAYDRQIQALLERHALYEEYVKIAPPKNILSRERWTFISKNFSADATKDLRNFNSLVLLLLGEKDIHVNVKETEMVYRNTVAPSLLTVVTLPNTEHSMLSTQTADSQLRAILISLFAPRQITVEEYMDQIEQFLKKLPKHASTQSL